MKMKSIGINLISFSDTKSVGTLVFTRRLIREWFKKNISNTKFVVYIQKGLNIKDFGFPTQSSTVEIIEVPKFRNSVHRIIFEQTLFYFYLKKTDFLFTPSLSLPIFGCEKKILTLHDMIPFIDDKKYGKLKSWCIKSMTRLFANRAWRIITVSENSKKDIIRFLNYDSTRIDIIYNFISEDEVIAQVPHDVPRTLSLSDLTLVDLTLPFFVTVSTLQPGKNIERLVEAFVEFRKVHPEYYLYLIGGKGWKVESIFRTIQNIDKDEHVKILGYQDDNNLALIYECCQAVVYVSLYEGFGIPPLEGFYHNKLCLASNTSSIPEVVGRAGILVNPFSADEIAAGMVGILQAQELKKYIPDQISKFSPQQQIRKFINVFNE